MMLKREKCPFFLVLLLPLFAACGVTPQTAANPRMISACQVERPASPRSAAPGGGFSMTFGGLGSSGGGSRSSAGGNTGRGSGSVPQSSNDNGSQSNNEAGTAPARSTVPKTSDGAKSRSSMGAGLSLNLGELFRHLSTPEVPNRLFDEGPRFEDAFSMACIPVRGFVRGGWPLVIDYQAEPGTLVSVEIHVEGQDPVVLPLPGGSQRNVLKLKLPERLGDKLTTALFLVRGVKDQPGAPVLGRVQVFGLGCGPRAVGSVAIDQVDFKPGVVHLGKKETARFSFYSRSDFNRAVAEVMRVDNQNGDLQIRLARSIPLEGGVAAGTWIGRQEARIWDGTDANRQVSLGQHLMQVRAWLGAQEGGDWVAAWSAGSVEVAR